MDNRTANIVAETRKLLEDPNVSWYVGQKAQEVLAQFCSIVENLCTEIANLSVCDFCVQDAVVRACRLHGRQLNKNQQPTTEPGAKGA